MAVVRKPPTVYTPSLFDIVVPEQTPEVTPEAIKLPTPAETAYPRAIAHDVEALERKMMKAFETFRYRHQMWDVFRDFCLLAACTISNSIDKFHFDEREKEYLTVAKRYNKEELDAFCQILALLAQALEARPADILGRVFHRLEITSKDKGQFFTPQCVADCMGFINATGIETFIEEKGYITMQEPAVGGGSMIFGFCHAMAEQGLNYQKQLHVTAIDIDLRCAHMAYVQMSLLGIPGVVYHGNTLSMGMQSVWYTPMHALGGWSQKLWPKEEEEERPVDEAAA